MNVEIRHRPSFATIFAELEPGDAITAESDAMASMDTEVEMTTGFNGGFLKGLILKFFGGEYVVPELAYNSSPVIQEHI